MANIDNTAPQSPRAKWIGDEWRECYAKHPRGDRTKFALEMLSEIRDRDSRLNALAISITNMLKPDLDGDSPDFNAFRLAEIMEEMLSDVAQHQRLQSCIEALGLDGE